MLQHFEAVHARHINIEDDDVRREVLRSLKATAPVLGDKYFMFRRLEDLG